MNVNITNPGKVSIKSKVLRALWAVVYIFLFKPFRTKFFNTWRLMLLKLFGADVQWDSGVYATCKVWAPWNLKMGHNAWLGPNTHGFGTTRKILCSPALLVSRCATRSYPRWPSEDTQVPVDTYKFQMKPEVKPALASSRCFFYIFLN